MNDLRAALKGKRILIVDDEEDLREILVDEFESYGAQVLEAKGGFEAFRLLMDQDVDLIVSDIRMRDGTGVELLQKVGALNKKNPRVILMTGFADITPEEAMRQGAAAVFLKPFELNSLLSKAAEIVNTKV